MAKDGTSRDGGSSVAFVIAGALALGALGLVYYFHGQAAAAEKALVQSEDDYREMQQRMKKPVEDFVRRTKGQPAGPKEEPTGDLLIFLDRKAREAQVPAGSFTITRNATSTTGAWQESSYTVAFLTEKKDTLIKRNPVVDFLGKVERESPSTKSKTLQITFSGDDLKSATIGFSQFKPK